MEQKILALYPNAFKQFKDIYGILIFQIFLSVINKKIKIICERSILRKYTRQVTQITDSSSQKQCRWASCRQSIAVWVVTRTQISQERKTSILETISYLFGIQICLPLGEQVIIIYFQRCSLCSVYHICMYRFCTNYISYYNCIDTIDMHISSIYIYKDILGDHLHSNKNHYPQYVLLVIWIILYLYTKLLNFITLSFFWIFKIIVQMYRNLFKIFRAAIPLLIVPYSLKTYHSFFWNKKAQNNIQGRVFIDVQVSNKPCQDRNSLVQLKNINGYAVAVFDGHGGWQMSNFCNQVMLDKLDQRLAVNKLKITNQQQLIKTSLRQAFWEVQSQFLQTARKGYKFGFSRMGRVGSCALVCVVANNKVYSANSGDSLGIIVQQDQNRSMKYTQINKQWNVNSQQERQRLRKLFPDQDDIVICKKVGKSCYIKGRLQPSKSLGDFRLKYAQFNNPQKFSNDHDFQSQLKVFTGPYVQWQPQINVFPLKKSSKSIILASDGLWDELQRQQVAELFKNNKISQMPKILIERALQKAAQKQNKTVQQIRQMPRGKTRDIHDDITVVVVDLEGQFRN